MLVYKNLFLISISSFLYCMGTIQLFFCNNKNLTWVELLVTYNNEGFCDDERLMITKRTSLDWKETLIIVEL